MSPARRAPRTLSIGGATYDLFLKMPASVCATGDLLLPRGSKVHIDRVVETTGGGACNTSVGLARLGCSAGFCGVIGSDQWGERLLHTLKCEGVDVTPATIVEGETSSFSILLTLPDGERTILAAAGASEHLHDVTVDLRAAANADAIVLNHLHESSCVILDNVVALLANTQTIHLTWNPGGCQIRDGMDAPCARPLLPHTDLLLLNREEAAIFTGAAEPTDALRILTDAGVRIACITDGPRGTWASDGSSIMHCPTVENATIVDTTGAGDAFCTAATWAMLQGATLPELLIAGTLNAVSVLGAMGAQAGLLSRDVLEERTRSHTLDIRPAPFADTPTHSPRSHDR